MTTLKDGTVQCRVKITGTFRGIPFEYIDPPDYDGSQFLWSDGDKSFYWWSYGNMACDCNRVKFLPEELKPLILKRTSENYADEPFVDDPLCGYEILIDRIEPIDFPEEVLILDETAREKEFEEND